MSGRQITDAEVEAARAARNDIVARMEGVLTDGTFVCLPTTAAPAPLKGERISARQELRSRNGALASIAGTLGAPQISLPLGEVDGLPVGLSLLGARGSDEVLMGFAEKIADALHASE